MPDNEILSPNSQSCFKVRDQRVRATCISGTDETPANAISSGSDVAAPTVAGETVDDTRALHVEFGTEP